MSRGRDLFGIASLRIRLLLLVVLAALVGAEAAVGQAGSLELAGVVAGTGLLALMAGRELFKGTRALKAARSEIASQNRLRDAMFIAAKVGMSIVDEGGRWVDANPALCTMLGYSREELQGRSFLDVTHPADKESSSRAFQAVQDGVNTFTDREKRYVARDGRVICASVTASAFTEWAGGHRYQVAQIQDVTSRKGAGEELEKERQLLNSFLRKTFYQICFKDLEGRYIRMSDTLATSLGFAHEEAIGKTDFDVFSREHASAALADEQTIIRTGTPILDREERVMFRHGGQGWMSTSKMPLEDIHGAVIGTVTVSNDITTRKRADGALRESEVRWRTLLAQVQEIVELVDSDGVVTYVSPSVERWLGFGPEEMIGRKLSWGTHPDDTDELARALEQATPTRPLFFSRRVKAADGSWRSLECRVVSLRDDPLVAAVLIVSRDVTERLALEREQERLELDRRVSQRLEAVGQLASGIAHEINTPLQFVGDSVTFLREAVDELVMLTGLYRETLYGEAEIPVEERRKAMREAEEAADVDYLCERIPSAFARTADGIQRVRTIVQAMKRFSHTSGTEVAAADLNEAIETTLAVCRNEYKYVAEVVLNFGDLPPVICNIGELNQVLLNLIINSAQAIEQKVGDSGEQGQITISTRLEGDEVIVEVADDGPGVPAEIQDRIYEPFFTTKEVGKGTGQGLALARNTIGRHGGSLECISAPGEGATFTIRLPLEHAERDTERLGEAA